VALLSVAAGPNEPEGPWMSIVLEHRPAPKWHLKVKSAYGPWSAMAVFAIWLALAVFVAALLQTFDWKVFD
jgi:hypothetical protein